MNRHEKTGFLDPLDQSFNIVGVILCGCQRAILRKGHAGLFYRHFEIVLAGEIAGVVVEIGPRKPPGMKFSFRPQSFPKIFRDFSGIRKCGFVEAKHHFSNFPEISGDFQRFFPLKQSVRFLTENNL